MIQLKRARNAEAIAEVFRGAKRIEKLRMLIENRRRNLPFNSDFWKSRSFWKEAKKQLRLESAGKCAYCEASTTKVAHGDVEHFRPKDRYWWLAYCYENYSFACQVCNQSNKGNKFPISGPQLAEPPLPPEDLGEEELLAVLARITPDPLREEEGMSREEFVRILTAEQTDLPDPYLIDPEPLFRWQADPNKKEVAIEPRDGSPDAQRVHRAAADVFGLNRDELKRARWVIYEELEYMRDSWLSDQVPPHLRQRAADLMRRMMGTEAEFAGMVRYFVRDDWGLHLP